MTSIRFATTLDYLLDIPFFAEHARGISIPSYNRTKDYSIPDQIYIFFQVLRAAMQEKALLLFSSRGVYKPELLAILFISFLPKRLHPVIVLTGDMWEPNNGLRGKIEKTIIQLADRAVNLYAVQSTAELSIFPKLWGVCPDKMRFIHYMNSISEEEISAFETDRTKGFIFAGGDRFRDYDPVIEAARRMPDKDFILATSAIKDQSNLPSNVRAEQVSAEEYNRLMQTAAIVIVPLQRGLHRASGHQTYLNAMLAKKFLIVNDVHGVRDHIQDGKTGLIVEGTPESYIQALEWVLDPAHSDEVQRIEEAASNDVETRFSPEKHAERLLEIMEEAITTT